MRLRFDTFLGEIPRRDPKMLPLGAAAAAENVDLASGALRPLLGHTGAHTFPTATTYFLVHDGAFIRQTAPTTFAPGPVDDTRLYIASEGSPPRLREMPSGTEHTLALPTPTAPPTLSIETPAPAPGSGDPPNRVETRLYATSWVTDLDEETPPSPLSEPIDVEEGATVQVNIIDFAAPVGTRINRIRVYCSQTSVTGLTGLYFVKELSAGTQTFIHDFTINPLQELLSSADYDPPPDTLEGITALWNGMIAGFSGRSLYFCEPFIPHAWPAKYVLKTDYEIVGLAATGQFLTILTTGTPYIAQGSAPENMVLERLDANMPCVSKEGIVDIGMGVMFPSHQGLVLMQGGAMNVVSRELYDRRAWRALKPETIRAAHYHGRYLFSYDPDGTRRTAMVDMAGETPGLVHVAQSFSAAAYDLVGGDLYFSDGTTAIRTFNADDGAVLNLTWNSGIIELPTEIPMGCIKIDGEILSGQPTVAVYADDALNTTVTSFNQIERLQAGQFSEWQVRVSGACRINRITLAGTPDELLG